MCSTNIYRCVVVMACALLVTRVAGVPRYVSTTPQVGDVERNSPILRNSGPSTTTSVNNGLSPIHNANVLDQIKLDAQTCKPGSDLDSPSASQSSKVKPKTTTVDNKEWNSKMSMDAGTVLVAAALSLSDSKLAEIAKDAYCFQNNSQRAQKNRGVPESLSDARNSKLYRELPEELSILHNFREDLKLDTPTDRLIAGLGAAAEYKAWKDHKMDRSEWKYLDPDLPNIKFIEEDGGHKEAVYNRHTEARVDYGNNQGTYNDYDQDSTSIEKAAHGVKDVGDWGLCGTPADNEKISTKWGAVLVDIIQGKLGEIDTSRLEELLKEQIGFLEFLITRGERATKSAIAIYNTRAEKILEEVKRLSDKINSLSVSDDEKVRIAKEKLAKVKELSERLAKLIDSALKDKVIDHITPISLPGSNSEVSQREDDGSCKCENPSVEYTKVSDSIPAAVMCKKCGKTAGVALQGKIISKNPAVSRLPVK